ncbi:AraC family transcriptional regulator [Paenibacillus psychroresistens]|uniref:AraC family transcriptional regulator n=1 Tax=Paenibacillus psychroresistens TaxID=1778678 RepID=A0A6B8RHN2_9BACL|nr:AraC family transcriptional regulator [Paenibacillus psychroresistens]QGQ95043.1 AraC family transcriptional regulator [Paenibacillus psychroresistens]
MKHIALPTINANSFICFPESVGIYNDFPEHNTFRAADEFPLFNIHFITKGKGYVELDGKVHELKKGDSFLFFPMQSQHYYSSQDDPWEVYWIHFYGDKMKEFLSERGFYRTNLWTMNQWNALQLAFDNLINEAEQYKLLHPALLSTMTYGIITEYMMQAIPLTPRREQDGSATIVQLLAEMQDEACQPFELKAWAAKAGVSTFYFCKLFRKTTQLTPMEFISLCRIRQAKQLLLEQKSLPITQIALECGYPSVSYFIQRFKKQEGLTPLEYRKSSNL